MLKQSITMKILQAKVNLQNSIDSYNSQKKNKDLAEYIYNSTKEKYLKGISSSMELTQAQMQYFSALQQYYQSVMDFLKAKNELEKLMNK
jgi:outer membrane protein TolC